VAILEMMAEKLAKKFAQALAILEINVPVITGKVDEGLGAGNCVVAAFAKPFLSGLGKLTRPLLAERSPESP